MDRRTLAALGLAAGGLAQVGYGVFLGGADLFALVSFGEGAGLILVAAGLWRGQDLRGPWVVAGLVVAALCVLPWFATLGPLTEVGPLASVLNNTGSVLAALAVLGLARSAPGPSAAWQGVRLGLGLQALGTFVRLPGTTAVTEWTFAFTLAFLGFALATATLPRPPQASAAASRAVPRAARKAP